MATVEVYVAVAAEVCAVAVAADVCAVAGVLCVRSSQTNRASWRSGTNDLEVMQLAVQCCGHTSGQ